ncbi:MAG: radical SAM protein [Elusimicrobia bacterium]|nr:radical SAM protein [Elusimicrobiota bacterium]
MSGLASSDAPSLAGGLATNKEIRRFKVAINTACPLRCEYCFIDKESGEVVSWPVVQALIGFMLSSPGQVKKLLIYGGEPFLKFDLAREIALYARARAAEAKKDLDLSICTSGVSVSRGQLEFLRDQSFFLSVSLDGGAETHDRRRRLKNGAGSWARIRPNLDRIFDVMGRRRTMAIQCVHPDNVERMLENFQALVGMGFENVEIEVIHGFGWEKARTLFRPMLGKVLEWVWSEAREGRRRFLVCSLAPLMLKEGVILEDHCPFHSSMECYPDGSYSFYPFAFVDWEGRRRSAVGSAKGGVSERYRACAFSAESQACRNCTADYYSSPGINQGNDPYRWRTEMARAFMDRVALAAKSDPMMREYLREALVRCRIS